MKILYVTTISGTMPFFSEHIKMLQSQGHIVELACNMDKPLPESVTVLGCNAHNFPFSRSPLSRYNLKAYTDIKKLINEENYDVVHTHTPNASVLVRLAARKLRKNGLKVMYTAHGFHFYKGAPLKNWLLYYPVEWLCAHWTDVLISINQEDFILAQKEMKAKKVCYVPGVGFNLARVTDVQLSCSEKRKELGVQEDAVLMLSVGELNLNKNHITILRALGQLQNSSLNYCIAGDGAQIDALAAEAKALGIARQVHFLGFRTDVAELYHAADFYVHPSYREGLSVALMEAMSAGLPCVVSDIRGNTDLIAEGKGGYLLSPKDVAGFARAISDLAENAPLRQQMGSYNAKAVEMFDTIHVKNAMEKIYQEVLDI